MLALLRPLPCSYPFLVGRHGAEFGYVPQSCQEYTGDGACRRECLDDGDKVVKARNYHYVGGYYGACSELEMLKVLKRGPIVVAFNAPPDLLYFHHGVYSHALSHGRDECVAVGVVFCRDLICCCCRCCVDDGGGG